MKVNTLRLEVFFVLSNKEWERRSMYLLWKIGTFNILAKLEIKNMIQVPEK